MELRPAERVHIAGRLNGHLRQHCARCGYLLADISLVGTIYFPPGAHVVVTMPGRPPLFEQTERECNCLDLPNV